MVTPKYFGLFQLSLLTIKSYIYSKTKEIPIVINKFYCEDDPDETARKICDQQPRVAAFSLYVWTEKVVLKICRRIKELDPTILIVVGGNLPTFQADIFLDEQGFIDVALKGEAEESAYQFFQALAAGEIDFSHIPNLSFRKDGDVIHTRRANNFSIENANYPLLLDDFQDTDIVFYETSRGCKNGCKYCAYNMNYNAKPTAHYYPWEKVESDLTRIFQLKKLTKMDFADSTILTNRKRGLKFLRLINRLNAERCAKKQLPVQIAIDASLEDFDDEILLEFKRMSTLAYGFGLQSIDKDVLDMASRRYDLEKFSRYYKKLVEKSGAKVNLEIMFGLPGDTFKKFCRTLEYTISELNAHFVVCFRFAVLPGSIYWDEKEKHQIVSEPNAPFYLLSQPLFPAKDLRKAEILSFYIQLIYTGFRGIKRVIDKNFHGRKVEAYQVTVQTFLEKYGHFFDNKNLRQGDVYEYFGRLSSPENADIKLSIQRDLRQVLKTYISEEAN